MKKIILKRSLMGAPIGLLFCQMMCIMISILINDGNYYTVVPELITVCGTETNAVIAQTLCVLLYGAIWGGISVIWEIDDWSILKQSVVHFLISSIVTFPIAYFTRWMEHTLSGILLYFGIFAVIYIGIWIVQYFSIKKKITQLNEKVQEKKYFIVSLCKNGILGGGMVVDTQKVTYCTGKVTVPKKFRHLEMPYDSMESASKGMLLFLPTVTLKMKGDEEYKFVVFSRRKFLNIIKEQGVKLL